MAACPGGSYQCDRESIKQGRRRRRKTYHLAIDHSGGLVLPLPRVSNPGDRPLILDLQSNFRSCLRHVLLLCDE